MRRIVELSAREHAKYPRENADAAIGRRQEFLTLAASHPLKIGIDYFDVKKKARDREISG